MAKNLIKLEGKNASGMLRLSDALEEHVTLVHEDVGSNISAHVIQSKGNYDSARAWADVVISRRLLYDRGTAAPMETRGVVAHFDQQRAQIARMRAELPQALAKENLPLTPPRG